jgi:mRNA interferase MazF
MAAPRRGEVWFVELNPSRGTSRGAGAQRPALIVSVDAFNRGKAGLVFIVPLTARFRGLPTHVDVPPAGGVHEASWPAARIYGLSQGSAWWAVRWE